MKSIIIFLLLCFTLNAQTIWYIDRDAGGSNNGTSWTNAWLSINNINWASVGDGDSIYISGGSDSTLYRDYAGGGTGYKIYPAYGTYGLDGRVFSQEVVIAPSWQSGHDGDVYLGAYSNVVQWILEIHNISNIKLTGFNFIDNRTATYGTMIYLGGAGVDGRQHRDSLITIENCHIVGNALGSMIYLSGYKIILRNNIIEQPLNENTSDQDPIGISNGLGGHTIDGNIIITRNGYTSISGTADASVTITATSLTDTRLTGANAMTTDYHKPLAVVIGSASLVITSNDANTFYGIRWTRDSSGVTVTAPTPANGSAWSIGGEPHKDGIQISNIGYSGMSDYTRHTLTVSNNLIIDTNPRGTSWNVMMYNYGWDYTPPVDFLIYNNIIVSRKTNTALGGIALGRLTRDYYNTIKMFNNTIILKNNTSGTAITNWTVDTFYVKNNLIVVDTTCGQFYNLDDAGQWASTYKDINYNHYAEYGGLSGNIAVAGSNYDWTAWQSSDNTNGSGIDSASTNSNSTAVTFTSKYDTLKASYYTTTGRDAGVDLSATYPFLATDILGNPRTGAWDIGALEYQGTVGTPTRVRMRQIIIQ